MKSIAILFLTASTVWAQTNLTSVNSASPASNSIVNAFQSQTNQSQDVESARNFCIQNRRSICGKILKILPDGLVVESGYTNLVREPLVRSWLIPGSALAGKSAHLVESSEPGAICIGTVFLTDYPKSRRIKPKLYDYVIIEGYPAGQYTYNSVGDLQKTVRRFSASISAAVKLNLEPAKK